MIRLHNVSKSFDGGNSFAVRNISFHIERGETLVLLGSSGSGKSTTLKTINRLIEPTSGEIEIGGKNILHLDPIELRRSIGYVFQGIGLFPHMTVEENVGVVLRLLGQSRAERSKRARELLSLVELDPDIYATNFPEELSGGQQQRVGVARALAADPECLLMDEPFGAVDALTRKTLQDELLKLKQRLKKTIVFVTHDIFEALVLADRIAVFHEGNLEQIAAPHKIVANPASDFVRDLFQEPARNLELFREFSS